jgi:hypothetical protein
MPLTNPKIPDAVVGAVDAAERRRDSSKLVFRPS